MAQLHSDHKKLLLLFLDHISQIHSWTTEDIKRTVQTVSSLIEMDYKAVTHTLRLVLTGSTVGIGMIKFIHTLGLSKTRDRIEIFLNQ
jgi:glutamyl/glutaminyl-tRNA synthetase